MKIKKPILLMVTAILMITACALMVNAGWQTSSNVTLVLPADNTFISVNDTFVNFSFYWINYSGLEYNTANCTLYNSTSWTEWNHTNDTTENITYGLLYNFSITDTYTHEWTVNCTNSTVGSGTANISATPRTITYDATPPAVTNSSPLQWLSGTAATLNITITDASSGVDKDAVYYLIYNSTCSSAKCNNISVEWVRMTNTSSGNKDWFVNTTFDTTDITDLYGDGLYNITFKANDTITAGYGSDNQNITENVTYCVGLDNTDPVIEHSCDTTATFKSGAITCTCSATDATSDVNEGTLTYTEHPSTGTRGTFTTTCTVSDYAGNEATDTITYTVRETGGAPRPEPGTGVPTITTMATVTQTIAAITADTAEAVAIDAAEISITGISITPTADVSNVKVTVQSLSEKPAAAPAPEDSVYQYLDITATNVAGKLKTGEITFEIPKSWITSRNIDKDKVILSRYANGKWNALTTTLVEEGTTSITYKATTPGFSYFVITGGEKAEGEVAEEVEKGEAPTMPTIPNWMYYLIIIIIIIIVVGYFWKKKKK